MTSRMSYNCRLSFYNHFTAIKRTDKDNAKEEKNDIIDTRKKQPLECQVVAFEFCRGTVTRTQDPLVPNQMR